MAKPIEEEEVTYLIFKAGFVSDIRLMHTPKSAYETYCMWVTKYGANCVSIERSKILKTYGPVSPEELEKLASQQ